MRAVRHVWHGDASDLPGRPSAKALEPGLPESFNVMVKELQSLALDIELTENRPA